MVTINEDIGLKVSEDISNHGVSYLQITNKSVKRIDPKSIRIEHCCGSCAEGHTCESDLIRDDNETSEQYMERLKNHRIEQQRKIDYGKTC